MTPTEQIDALHALLLLTQRVLNHPHPTGDQLLDAALALNNAALLIVQILGQQREQLRIKHSHSEVPHA